MISQETLLFFQELLRQVKLPADIPDFDEQAARISTVRRELAEGLAASEKV